MGVTPGGEPTGDPHDFRNRGPLREQIVTRLTIQDVAEIDAQITDKLGEGEQS
jgi:hypothetical protein